MASQRCTSNKIGMKHQCPSFGLNLYTVTFDTIDLPRCQKNKCPLLIIVILATITHISALHIFEKDGIKTV